MRTSVCQVCADSLSVTPAFLSLLNCSSSVAVMKALLFRPGHPNASMCTHQQSGSQFCADQWVGAAAAAGAWPQTGWHPFNIRCWHAQVPAFQRWTLYSPVGRCSSYCRAMAGACLTSPPLRLMLLCPASMIVSSCMAFLAAQVCLARSLTSLLGHTPSLVCVYIYV